jgi:hypothetical protein
MVDVQRWFMMADNQPDSQPAEKRTISQLERSAGVLTRSTRNANRMSNISKAFPLPPAAAGTAALRRIAG